MPTKPKLNGKSMLVITVLVGVVIFMASYDQPGKKKKFYAPTQNPPEWEQHPPNAESVTVTKLTEPLATGENMLLEIQYGREASVVSEITVYPNDDTKVTLHDDGKEGDEKRGDLIYSSYIKEELDKFSAQMEEFNENLQKAEGKLEVFKGRLISKEDTRRSTLFFDKKSFDSYQKTDISRELFSLPTDLNTASLGTLKVNLVNDRPYDNGGIIVQPGGGVSTGGGTVSGRNFGGPPPPPPPIVKWKSLFITDQSVVSDPVRTFNPCTKVGNPNGAWTFGTLMKGMAFQTLTGITARTFVRTWLNHWMVDQTINFELVRNRSAQMLNQVIRPWIRKARNNFVLNVTTANWQAEWDLTHQDSLLKYAPFSLTAIVNRLDLRGNSGYGGFNNPGETRFIFTIIRNTNAANCIESVANGVFDGFTVIFEFGNSQNGCAQLQAYGNQWANLSTLGFGAGFNAALEAITHSVTDSNRVASKPNRSALNQLRTNEIAITNNSGGTVASGDASPRWQFRQFKIQAATKQLGETTIDLEPNTIYNRVDGASAANQQLMAAWVNTPANTAAIKANNFTIPLSLPGGQPFLAAKINYQSISPFNAPHFFDGNTVVGNPGRIVDDSARHILSLNTCSGCHSRETKTKFTHLRYVDKGTPITYWNNLNPIGETDGAGNHALFISGFLTGFEVTVGPSPGLVVTPTDDSVGDPNDGNINGDFWVSDAAGRTYPGFPGIPRKWGFNDLKRRSQDLTNFLTNPCAPIKSIGIAQLAFFQPLNMVH